MAYLTSEQVKADQRRIRRLRVLANTPNSIIPGRTDTRWALLLVLRDLQEHVLVQMLSPEGKSVGVLKWSSYVLDDSVHKPLKEFEYYIDEWMTVAQVAAYGHGRNHYRVTKGDDRSGCRWWIFTVLNDLFEWDHFLQKVLEDALENMLSDSDIDYTALPGGNMRFFYPQYVRAEIVEDTTTSCAVHVKFSMNNKVRQTDFDEWEEYGRGARYLVHRNLNLLIDNPETPSSES
ncbi:hypothetical protein AJ79_01558 [Helicocarpus griseus UAMH5409]|uniref:DUF7770 domain-containing protein n=1 Tax=Helicocarpus griseus UAMH5409 TaxID=1447875 RepID=A0A2B7Y5D5_9EURO|nr:hypothetical protein AJ79_01558 [Helicocarpus griseus UAMH5409]